MKKYMLTANEPLTEFDIFLERTLNEIAEQDFIPKKAVMVWMSDDAVATFYHDADLSDMMVAKGFIDLDIVNDTTIKNLPYFIDLAMNDEMSDEEEEGDIA